MKQGIRRIGIIGDVHAEHDRLSRALDWFSGQDLDAVLCTGDVADGAGCIDRSCALLREAGVLTVAGNHDRWLLTERMRHVADAHRAEALADSTLDYLRALPPTREIDTVAGPLLLCHGVGEHDMGKVWPGTRGPDSIRRSETLDALIDQGRHRVMIHGHLHYRVMIHFESLLLLNAGTLKGPRAGVSVLDFEAGTVAAHEFDEAGTLQPGAAHALDAAPPRRVWRSTADFDGRWEPVLL